MWQAIETAPHDVPLLLAAKYEPQHLEWRYGVGQFSKFLGHSTHLWDWPWSCAPQFWQHITPPVIREQTQ